MEKEAWQAAAYGVTKIQAQLSNWTELNLKKVWISCSVSRKAFFKLMKNWLFSVVVLNSHQK